MSAEPRQSTFSPHWYRVEGLRPRLREHVRVHRHAYRGVRWYVLQDPAVGRHHRVSPDAFRLIARLDGVRSLRQVWDEAIEQSEDSAPSQGELIALLAQLHAADLLRCEVPPDAQEVFERYTRSQRKTLIDRLANPLALRVRLFDPDRWLELALPFVRPLVGRVGLAIWLAVLALGALVGLAHWRELDAPALAAVLDPQHLPWLVLAYVGVKLCHELGHALATKLGGGEVHEFGVIFLVFFPSPYVDASSASSFPDKRWRMAVSAAGVGVELFLASVALCVFCSVGPGWLSMLSRDVVLIAGLSTLVFNGNPLLRFDGYYVLADALEIPNLARRAQQELAALFTHHVLGLPERRAWSSDDRERTWLVAYGLLSFACRIFVMLAIAALLATRFHWAGVIIALWGLLFMFVVPVFRSVSELRADPRVSGREARVAGALGALVALAVALVFVVPLPLTTRCEGVVWLPENAQVRAGADGFVVRLAVAPGTIVREGAVLIETRDPEAETRVAVLEARLRELEQRADGLRLEERVQGEIADDEVRALKAELARARERSSEGRVLARSPGRFMVPNANDLPGRFVERGQVLGWVAGELDPIVRAIVTQEEIAAVQGRTRRVEVRLIENPGVTWRAELTRQVPAASHRLPSLALGAAGGGRLAVDMRDRAGLTSVAKIFSVDLVLPGAARTGRIGGRALVRFEHDPEPLIARLTRAVRRLFLRELRV